MDQQQVQRARGMEPAAPTTQWAAEDSQAADRPKAAVDWEGYSLDTLSAILDGDTSRSADW
jgi:hypothetical protein